jgi:rare lipoprotein A
VISRKGGIAALVAGLAVGFLAFNQTAFAGDGCGLASWYGLGGTTASGEQIVQGALTAAHRTLPFGTRVKVENLDNGRAVVVRINDRGPFIAGRDIDVTRAAAEELGFIRAGVAKVRMTVVGEGAGRLNPCGSPLRRHRTVPVIAASKVPMPRERPFDMRFGYAFAAPDQTSGSQAVARVLALRANGASGTAVAEAEPRTYPEGFFTTRFTYAFLPTEATPEAQVARAPAVRAAAFLGRFASAE